MSAYKDLVRDFPMRCKDLLTMFQNSARHENREVTHLLTIATSSLIWPFERLHKKDHSSRDDQRFAKANAELESELKAQCGASRLWQPFSDSDWRYKKLCALQGDPDAWGLNCGTETIAAMQTETVLGRILRNALAHGNVWSTGDPIETLVFVSRVCYSKPEGPFHSLQCRPSVFGVFVQNWVQYLESLDIP